MAAEVRYYIVEDQQKNQLEIRHFDRISAAIRAYKVLPAASHKTLGFQMGELAADLARCIPIFPGDQEGEDVIALDFLLESLGNSRESLISAARDLAECLRVRYCLYRGCLLKIPTAKVLPKGLRGRYLWPTVPGEYETCIQWLKVVDIGSLSVAEFKRRYRSSDAAAGHFPLIVRLNVHSQTENRVFRSLDVTPWEFMLLERASKERQTAKGGDKFG